MQWDEAGVFHNTVHVPLSLSMPSAFATERPRHWTCSSGGSGRQMSPSLDIEFNQPIALPNHPSFVGSERMYHCIMSCIYITNPHRWQWHQLRSNTNCLNPQKCSPKMDAKILQVVWPAVPRHLWATQQSRRPSLQPSISAWPPFQYERWQLSPAGRPTPLRAHPLAEALNQTQPRCCLVNLGF